MYISFTATVIDQKEFDTVKSITGKCMVSVWKELTFWMIATPPPAHFKVVVGTSISNNGAVSTSFISQEYTTVNGVPTLVE